MFLCLIFLECDGFLAVSCWFFPLDRQGCLQSLAVVLCIFRDPPQCFSQQPGFFPFASALCLSCVCLKGIKSLHESFDGSGIVAKVYSVSRSTGMCFSQLDHLLYHKHIQTLVCFSVNYQMV